MSESKRQSIKQSLKLLPLYCMTKGNDESLETRNSAPKVRLQVPEPIDEFVDYTSDALYERSLKASQQLPEIVLETTEDGGECSCSSDSGGPAVEEAITVSAFGQAETGISSNMGAKLSVGNPTSAPHSVRRAEGLSIGSDRSPRGPTGQRRGHQEAPTAVAESQAAALHQLGDLMADDAEEVFTAGSRVPVRESAVEPLVAGSVNASHSITDTARSGGDPSDVRALKRTVRRLTSELSRLLMGRSSDEVEARKLLPGKGPLPPWLCDPRVFSPLMEAYDQQLLSAAKGGSGGGGGGNDDSVNAKLLDMEARVLDVTRENERLRVKLREAAAAGPASQTELDALTEQARLVLEENQLLIHQLRVQQDKAKLMQRGHLAEVAALKCRTEELEAENRQVRSEFASLHGKLQEVRDKYQSATLERETGELLSVDRMRTLTKELAGTRDEFARTNEELLHQLKKSERQKVKLTRALADATTERDELRIEVSELKNSAHLRHRENLQLQRSVKRRDTMEDCLESVLSTATDLQSELDFCNGKLKDQETDLTKLIDFLVGELTFHEKNITGQPFDEAPLNKLPNLTSKFEFVIKRFAALLKGNEDQREQMDKQIRYLQSLIRQKSQELQFLEAEQRTVEAGLETVWNIAASS